MKHMLYILLIGVSWLSTVFFRADKNSSFPTNESSFLKKVEEKRPLPLHSTVLRKGSLFSFSYSLFYSLDVRHSDRRGIVPCMILVGTEET